MNLTVTCISVDEAIPLRLSVLKGPLRTDAEMLFPEDNDETSFHVGVKNQDGIIIASGTFHKDGNKIFPQLEQYRLRGMACDPNFRGSGAGTLVIKFGEQEMIKRGATFWWCNARTGAIGFYEKSGLKTYGEEFQVPKSGPHYVMYKALC